jgi:hypothetical protein
MMILHDETVQRITDRWARETGKEERKLIRKKASGSYYRKGSEASAFVSTFSELSGGNTVLVKTIAEEMYFPESDHMKRRIRSGETLDAHSMAEGRAVMRSIVKQWGGGAYALI